MAGIGDQGQRIRKITIKSLYPYKGKIQENSNERKVSKGLWVRNNLRKPNKILLLLYLLDPKGVTDSSTPIVGYAISFPGTDRNDAESFMIHKQLLPQFNIDDDIDNNYNDDDY